MEDVIRYKIKGAEIKFERNGGLIVGFSSQTIADEQLIALRDIKEKYFLAFHCCDFSRCNLEILVQLEIAHIGIFHGSFGNAELIELSQSENLELIKLHDTFVSQSCISEIKIKKPNLEIVV